MLNKADHLSCEIMWWALVVIFGLIALSYIIKLCWLVGYAREDADPFQLDPFSCVRFMPCALFMWSIKTGEANLYLISLQAYICLSLWFFICVCAIMQSKVASRLTWGEYMKKQGREWLQFFTDIRNILLWIEAKKDKLTVRTRAGVGLGLIIISTWIIGLLRDSQVGLSFFLGVAAILFFIYKASISLHSCRNLLIFWLVYSVLFALSVAFMLPRQQNDIYDVFVYIAFVILNTLLWLLLAGAADDEPVQMGCNIINTMTTIALIVINVSVVWAERNLALPEPLANFWSGAQYYSTVILLPLVVAGYLAALLKSIQIYHAQRKANTK